MFTIVLVRNVRDVISRDKNFVRSEVLFYVVDSWNMGLHENTQLLRF